MTHIYILYISINIVAAVKYAIKTRKRKQSAIKRKRKNPVIKNVQVIVVETKKNQMYPEWALMDLAELAAWL